MRQVHHRVVPSDTPGRGLDEEVIRPPGRIEAQLLGPHDLAGDLFDAEHPAAVLVRRLSEQTNSHRQQGYETAPVGSQGYLRLKYRAVRPWAWLCFEAWIPT